MERVNYKELSGEKVKILIDNRESFEVVGLGGRMDSAVSKVENIIESSGLSCRVYLYGRAAAVGASFFGGVTGLFGVASAIAMATHNLATFNPDYEVAKHKIDNKLTVKYKK